MQCWTTIRFKASLSERVARSTAGGVCPVGDGGGLAPSRLLLHPLAAHQQHGCIVRWAGTLARQVCKPSSTSLVSQTLDLDHAPRSAAGDDGVRPVALQSWQCCIRSTESHLVDEDPEPAPLIGAEQLGQRAEGHRKQFQPRPAIPGRQQDPQDGVRGGILPAPRRGSS